MIYLEHPPRADLAGRIECIWMLRSAPEADDLPAGATRVFPDGCIELIVHAGERFHWIDATGRLALQPGSFVVGQLSRPIRIAAPRHVLTVGARFRPGGAYGWFGPSLASLADRVVPLEALWDERARDLEASILSAGPDGDLLAAMESALATLVGTGPAASAGVRQALSLMMAEKGVVRVQDLARAVAWSTRQLERRFADEVGCPPKQLARVVRFQYLLSCLATAGPGDWAGLAWDCGFADQAHLVREVRRLTDATPSGLNADALAIARLFVSEERLRRYFAASPAV